VRAIFGGGEDEHLRVKEIGVIDGIFSFCGVMVRCFVEAALENS
jgi:hypothetical protein